MLLAKFKKHHDLYLEEWVRAEEVLKLVERIKVEVFIPSIMELRYAARRIVQAHVDFNAGNATNDHLETHFIEAIENCKKARHDAIDSAIVFIHEQYNKLCEAVGLPLISKGFPKYSELRREMMEIDTHIVESRKNRNGLNNNYETIKREHLKKVVDLYLELETSKEVIEEIRRKEQKDFWVSVVGVAFIICIVGGVIVIVADKMGVFDWASNSQHEVATPSARPMHNTTKPITNSK